MIENAQKTTFEKPLVTVDIVVFTVRNNELQALLIKRKGEPFKNRWALPGGFVLHNESLEDAAKRELAEETGVTDVYLEQLYTFGEPRRDPRGRIITVAYFALIDSSKITLHATTDASDATWLAVNSISALAFDHNKILAYAIKRLRWKCEYTTAAFALLPEKFTLSHVQALYEIIFSQKFDKRNFRKKILSLGMLKKEEVQKGVSYRPPQLYSLKKPIGDIVEIL